MTERLHNVEQRKKNASSAVDKQGRLLLIEEEWLASLKLRDNSDKSNGSSSGKDSKKSWKSRGARMGKKGIKRRSRLMTADPMLELWDTRSLEQELMEQGEDPCGPI